MPAISRLLVIGLVAASLLSACSDDATPTPSGPTAAGLPEDDSPIVSPALRRECDAALEASEQAGAALESALGPGSEIAQNAAFFAGATSTAPEDIREDFKTIDDALSTFNDALVAAGADPADPSSYSDPDVLGALQAATSGLTDPAYQQAVLNIDLWVQENCG